MANDETDYFRFPGLIPMFLVPAGMALVTTATLCPEKVPYTQLGPVGSLTKYLVDERPTILLGIAYSAWLFHFVEALFTIKVCRDKRINRVATICWVLQTFLYGIFSLKNLLKYYPPPPHQRHSKND